MKFREFLTDYKKSSVNDFMELIDANIKIPKLVNYKLELYKIKNRKINQPDFLLGFWTTEDVDTKIGIESKPVFRAIFAMQISKICNLIKSL